MPRESLRRNTHTPVQRNTRGRALRKGKRRCISYALAFPLLPLRSFHYVVADAALSRELDLTKPWFINRVRFQSVSSYRPMVLEKYNFFLQIERESKCWVKKLLRLHLVIKGAARNSHSEKEVGNFFLIICGINTRGGKISFRARGRKHARGFNSCINSFDELVRNSLYSFACVFTPAAPG